MIRPDQVARQKKRESPEYKPFIEAEYLVFDKLVADFSSKIDSVRMIVRGLHPQRDAHELANYLELIDQQLTTAREFNRDIRRAAKVIVARRDREEKGVFRP